ncbi:MAG TPA: YbfB/YjiJ family MFS transporter, partial [Caldimonas sp.]
MSRGAPLPTLVVAAALALGSAVSLGLARFSYALLLPPMRTDLGWSYLTAGAMNTVNAAGYLAGALVAPATLHRFGARAVFLGGALVTALALFGHGLVLGDGELYALRFATGLGSAGTFVAGGVLAARLVVAPAPAGRPRAARASSGLVLGIYYGGTGLGIIASALIVPALAERTVPHAWQGAWFGLAALAAIATMAAAAATRGGAEATAATAPSAARLRIDARAFAPALLAYLLFGLGYIGYMTFVVTLLREERL